MPRIAGVDVPNEKRVEAAIQYIYGIGHTMADLSVEKLVVIKG